VRISVNGSDRDVPHDASVEDLVDELARSRKGTAVALNGEVVPKSEWASTRFTASDSVEILTAVGGG
jgi:sulfur carrier protein